MSGRVSRYLFLVIVLAIALLIPLSHTVLAKAPRLAALTHLIQPHPTALRIVPSLEEPLVATKRTSRQEDKALNTALQALESPIDVTRDFAEIAKPLENYLAKYPESGWSMAIQTNLGLGYYRSGYFSRALSAWEQAWELGRNANTLEAKRLTDRAVGELARMHARVGHADELETLFAEMGDRPITGAATEMITGAHEGLWVFRNDPGIAYLCGPKALVNLLQTLKVPEAKIKVADQARSGSHGFSLTQVSELANQAGFTHKLVHRKPGQPIPVPSVVNWNVHHYAAIVAEVKGKYWVKDPTFGSGDLFMTKEAIDAESSGYFLVPSNVKTTPWQEVVAQSPEAKAVYGMGYPGALPPGGTGPNDPKIHGDGGGPGGPGGGSGGSGGPPCGMCIANAHATVISLNLNDIPVSYGASKGPNTSFVLTYNQREASQPANFTYSNLGPKWSHSWLASITDDPTNFPGYNVTHVFGGGGYIFHPSRQEFSSISYQLKQEPRDGAILQVLPIGVSEAASIKSYELNFPDSSKQIFDLSDLKTAAPRRWFLTKVIDAQGNIVTLNYDSQFRLTSGLSTINRWV